MVTVVSADGFALRIYPNDHPPPHTHAVHSDGAARITLTGVPGLLSVSGLDRRQTRRALELVAEHRQALLEKWNEYHG